MLELLILAGNHPDQGRWASDVSSSLRNLFRQIRVHHYEHWSDPKLNFIDLDSELEVLRATKKYAESTVLFGKSAGVILAFMAYYDHIVSPMCAIFVGTPLHWAKENDIPIDDWMKELKVPVLYIQNEFDPVCNADELFQALPGSSEANHDLVRLDGSSHDYEDLDMLSEVIANFVDQIH